MIKDKPRYIWLSIFAFMFLLMITSAHFIFSRRFKDQFPQETGWLRPWLRFLGQMFIGVFTIIALPLMASAISGFIVYSFSSLFGEFGLTIHQIVLLIALYLAGVFATYRYDKWIKKNLPPIINKDGE